MNDSLNPYEAAKGESIDFLLSEGKECLQGTVALGVASDQRASAYGAFFGGGALALIAVAGSLLTSERMSVPFFAGALAAAFQLLLACWFSLRASEPVDFHLPGYEPKKLVKGCVPEANPDTLKQYVCEDIQMRIDENRKALERQARLTRGAKLLGIVAPIAGVGVYALFFFLIPS